MELDSPPPVDRKHALFLDFDGTLVDIVARPDLTIVSPQLLQLLERTHRQLDGALAIVSGRPVADLDRLISPLTLPAAGVHGAEYRVAGAEVELASEAQIPGRIREEIFALAAANPDLLIEDKGVGLALHYRQAPQLESMLRERFFMLDDIAGPDFVVQDGKMVFEMRPAHLDKGTAIEDFMTRAPFAGRAPVFLGDDVTDEHGFAIVNDLDGISIRIGTATSATVAQYRLADVAAVHEWLAPLAANKRFN